MGQDGGGDRETRRGRRVAYAVAVAPDATRDQVRIGSGLVGAEHRGDARVAVGEHRDPVITGTGADGLRDDHALARPDASVVLVGQVRVIAEIEPVEERRVEAGLDRTHGEPPVVCGAVGAVERSTAVEQVLAPRWSVCRPEASIAWCIAVNSATPSTIAASTT